jgi:hypothetical protein
MPSTINATPTSSGLISSADSSGVLALQTGGTTAVTIDGSQNVSIGTTSVFGKLTVSGGAGSSTVAYFASSNANLTAMSVRNNPANNTTMLSSEWNTVGTNLLFGIGGTEAMRIDTNSQIGIGISNPTTKVDIRVTTNPATDNGVGANTLKVFTNVAQGAGVGGAISLGGYFNSVPESAAFGQIAGRKENSTNGNLSGFLQFATLDAGGTMTERMRIDSAGNVGIGTSSPSSATNRTVLTLGGAASWGGQLNIIVGSTVHAQFGTDNFDSGLSCRIQSQDGIVFRGAAGAERMRITSGGDLLVGGTANIGSGYRAVIYSGGNVLAQSTTAGNGTAYNAFFNSTTLIGSITNNSNAGVLFNTTSDYRLKTVIAPVSDAGQRIDALEPIEYDWNTGGRTRGFLAHQFAEVYPNSVTGEKDAVDAEGKPAYQTMQASSSEVMADLIAEIQSLRKRVAQLESK